MPNVLRELLWALLYTALSLPVAYLMTVVVMSFKKRGYANVDPVLVRRVSVALAFLVFVGTLLARWLNCWNH